MLRRCRGRAAARAESSAALDTADLKRRKLLAVGKARLAGVAHGAKNELSAAVNFARAPPSL